MRLPVYNYDLELLTVVNLPPWAVEMVERNERIALTIDRGLPSFVPDKSPFELQTWFVYLQAFEISIGVGKIHRSRSFFLVCGDNENALLLKSCFAPGQQRAVRDREKEAFRNGIIKAFGTLGGMMGDQE